MVFVELAIVAAIFVADWNGFVPVSKTPFLLVLGWISLRFRALRWKSVGLHLNRSWTWTLLLGLAFGIVIETFQLLVTEPVVAKLTGAKPDLSDFQALVGNIPLALVALALAWTLAAIGEELVYRGYLMNRMADLGRHSRAACIVSTIVVSLVFGFGHMDQGIGGQVVESFSGLWLALLYLGTGRNLAVPIVAHGVVDTIDIVLIYFDCFPGM